MQSNTGCQNLLLVSSTISVRFPVVPSLELLTSTFGMQMVPILTQLMCSLFVSWYSNSCHTSAADETLDYFRLQVYRKGYCWKEKKNKHYLNCIRSLWENFQNLLVRANLLYFRSLLNYSKANQIFVFGIIRSQIKHLKRRKSENRRLF